MRRAMRWAFAPPSSAHIALQGAIDFSAGRSWLREQDGLTVQHLLTGAIGWALAETPEANARMIDGRAYPVEDVGVVMPVNLLGHAAGAHDALGVAIVAPVQHMSVREIAEATTRRVSGQRAGHSENPVKRRLKAAVDRIPGPAIDAALGVAGVALRSKHVVDGLSRLFPATTMVSNAGAVLGKEAPEGVLYRGASFAVPPRIGHLATMWATSFIQDEVIPVGGEPVVRPMLPVTLMFDHRAFDGVVAGRLMLKVAERLQHPLEAFGANGLGRLS